MNPLARALDVTLEATVILSFTKVGFDLRSATQSWTTPPRLDGRRVVVTGATSGLGREAALELGALGADVVVVGRSKERAEQTLSAMRAASKNDLGSIVVSDMSDLDQVRELGRYVITSGGCDVVIHNAGAITQERALSPQGHEVTFSAQVLGPHLLTTLLLGDLRHGAPGRVITVTSGGLYTQPYSLSALTRTDGPYDPVATYARVKRAQLVWTQAWARRQPQTALVMSAMHPGWSMTAGLSDSLPGFSRVMKPFLRSAHQGADTMVWLASCPDVLSESGELWLDRAPRPQHRLRRTRSGDRIAAQDELFAYCDSATSAYSITE